MIGLFNDDCLKILPAIPSQSIDAVICDPPYGTTACKWDSIIPLEPMWEQLKRIIKPNGAIVLFGSEPFSSLLRVSNLKMFKYDWVWEKSNPSNIALANKQPMKYHEIISIFCAGATKYYKQMIKRESNRIQQAHDSGYTFQNRGSEQTGLKRINVNSIKYNAKLKNPSSVLKFNSLRPNAKEFVKHPTQKPVALMEYLIKTYTNEGDIVLDFTMGSGTTGVAAVKLKRNFIGIELNQEYFQIAQGRIKAAEEANGN